jgi:hypothetical protein
MVNRPRVIGTTGETAVVRYLRDHGFTQAERRALHGTQDQGDIVGTPGICWEIKTGETAKSIFPKMIASWLAETEVERINSRETIGVLVMQRRGFGMTRIGEWWAVIPSHLAFAPNHDPGGYIWLSLENCVTMLKRMGYGQRDE